MMSQKDPVAAAARKYKPMQSAVPAVKKKSSLPLLQRVVPSVPFPFLPFWVFSLPILIVF